MTRSLSLDMLMLGYCALLCLVIAGHAFMSNHQTRSRARYWLSDVIYRMWPFMPRRVRLWAFMNDRPSSEMIERIRSERDRIANGLPPIDGDKNPLILPTFDDDSN